MPQNIITAGDATNGALISQGGNDGTLLVQTGPAGAKVNAANIDATGQATLLKTPNISTAQSMVRVNTANGYGSTNTKIRRFSGVATNQGSDITYADSAANGASFTINTSGVYAISYTEGVTTVGGEYFCASLNSSNLTTNALSIPSTEVLCGADSSAASYSGCASGSFYLAAGSVVRPHTAGGTGTAQNNRTLFTITRVA